MYMHIHIYIYIYIYYGRSASLELNCLPATEFVVFLVATILSLALGRASNNNYNDTNNNDTICNM